MFSYFTIRRIIFLPVPYTFPLNVFFLMLLVIHIFIYKYINGLLRPQRLNLLLHNKSGSLTF